MLCAMKRTVRSRKAAVARAVWPWMAAAVMTICRRTRGCMRAMQLDRLYYGVRDHHGALRGQLEGLLIVSIVAGHKAKVLSAVELPQCPGPGRPGARCRTLSASAASWIARTYLS